MAFCLRLPVRLPAFLGRPESGPCRHHGGWLVGACFLASLTAVADTPRQVLLLHSFGPGFAPYEEITHAFRTELSRLSPDPIVFTESSLAVVQFKGAQPEGALLDSLATAYPDAPPELVVAFGAPAARFSRSLREARFGTSAFLLLSDDPSILSEIANSTTTATALCLDIDLQANIRNLLTILPLTEHIYVIPGTSSLEPLREAILRREWAEFEPQVTFHWLGDQTPEQLLTTVTRLPPHSAIWVSVSSPSSLPLHLSTEFVQTIGHLANAPLFGATRSQLGLGIVGGPLIPLETYSRQGAEMAHQVLSGVPVRAVSPRTLSNTELIYDGQQLQRWAIPAHRLPSGSTVLHPEPNLWRDHQSLLLLALGGFVLLGGVIVTLAIALRRAREDESHLQDAADAAQVGLWRRHPERDEITASTHLRHLMGLPPTGPVSVNGILDRVHPGDRAHVQTTIEEAARDGRAFRVEHRIVCPDGSGVRWLSLQGRTCNGTNGHPRTPLGAVMDITQDHEARLQAELQDQELTHLSRVSSIGTLTSAIVHELNQPLGSILNNAQAARRLLLAPEPDLVEIHAIVEDVIAENRRAGEVIQRLRDLMRRGKSNLQRLDVNDNLREVIRLTRGTLLQHNVRLSRHLSPGLPAVMADRIQLQQIFLNLVTNACDAMASTAPEQRELTIESSFINRQVRIMIKDRGCGLPADHEEIFQPFHTTKEHGLGMGLAICRKLIVAHRGSLWAESNLHGGATFHVTLPTLSESS